MLNFDFCNKKFSMKLNQFLYRTKVVDCVLIYTGSSISIHSSTLIGSISFSYPFHSPFHFILPSISLSPPHSLLHFILPIHLIIRFISFSLHFILLSISYSRPFISPSTS